MFGDIILCFIWKKIRKENILITCLFLSFYLFISKNETQFLKIIFQPGFTINVVENLILN